MFLTIFFVVSVFFINLGDDQGRKTALAIFSSIQLLGTIILACSFNMWMANFGLFLMGLAIASGLRIAFVFIS